MTARLLMDPDTGDLVEVGALAITSDQPYSYAESKRVGMAMMRERQSLLKKLEERNRQHAAAEAAYRAKLREQIIVDKAAHGSTAGLEMARGAKDVVDLREARDVAAGLVKAAELAVKGADTDRATYHKHADWSMAYEKANPGSGG